MKILSYHKRNISSVLDTSKVYNPHLPEFSIYKIFVQKISSVHSFIYIKITWKSMRDITYIHHIQPYVHTPYTTLRTYTIYNLTIIRDCHIMHKYRLIIISARLREERVERRKIQLYAKMCWYNLNPNTSTKVICNNCVYDRKN